MNKKVAVILSTFNGEKYVEQQLQSIVDQTYPYLEVFIHDDGSTDGTVSIIKKFEQAHKHIHVADGPGGFRYPACFINLLEKVEGFDYYAFCDQDDVWLAHKIEAAVNQLSAEDDEIPALYYTAVEYCNSELVHVRNSRFAEGKQECTKLSLQSLLFGGEAMGMTFVFNNKARMALVRANQEISVKDWFLKLYCASCGVVYYDPRPSAKYRRHGEAVTGSSNPAGKLARYAGQIKEVFFDPQGFENQKKIIHYMNENISEEIKPENAQLIDLFSEPRSLPKCMRKFFWKERFRSKLLDEIGYRVAFLLGRI